MVTHHPHIPESSVDRCQICGIARRSHDPSPHQFVWVHGTSVFDEDFTTRDAADQFMRSCGLDPTEDAVGQLTEAFLPCLKIMCERGYDEEGRTWRAEGWRGMLWKGRDKSDRIWWHGWRHGRFHADSVLDAINYFGYYYRIGHQGDPWGTRGEPGEQ